MQLNIAKYQHLPQSTYVNQIWACLIMQVGFPLCLMWNRFQTLKQSLTPQWSFLFKDPWLARDLLCWTISSINWLKVSNTAVLCKRKLAFEILCEVVVIVSLNVYQSTRLPTHPWPMRAFVCIHLLLFFLYSINFLPLYFAFISNTRLFPVELFRFISIKGIIIFVDYRIGKNECWGMYARRWSSIDSSCRSLSEFGFHLLIALYYMYRFTQWPHYPGTCNCSPLLRLLEQTSEFFLVFIHDFLLPPPVK